VSLAEALVDLQELTERLRRECPWDREQTERTIVPHTVEEAYEVADAAIGRDDAKLADELGDLLFQVYFLALLLAERGSEDLESVARRAHEKLVRRHPHVFGDVEAGTAEQVLVNWEAIKKAEREGKREDASALAGVPVALPALQRAQRICGKAMSAGFRWSSVEGAVAKLREEQGELDEALRESGLDRDAARSVSPELRARVEHELGDVMLAAAHLAQYLEMDAEKLARAAVRRFEQRFRSMEAAIGRPLKECSLDEMLAAWQRAKES
jgi:MazG family protein